MSELSIGRKAPAFSLPNQDGTTVNFFVIRWTRKCRLQVRLQSSSWIFAK